MAMFTPHVSADGRERSVLLVIDCSRGGVVCGTEVHKETVLRHGIDTLGRRRRTLVMLHNPSLCVGMLIFTFVGEDGLADVIRFMDDV